MEFKFDLKENKTKIDEFKIFIDKNREKEGALMPVLQKAQGKFGYLPAEILEIISKELGIPLAEVYGVVTFYSQFSLIPKGEFKVGVCLGTACYVRGGKKLVDELKKQLSIEVGETTSDGKFSLEIARCIGACGLAPAMMIDKKVYKSVNPNRLKSILATY